MIEVSEQYKTDIRKQLRNRGFIKVVLGFIEESFLFDQIYNFPSFLSRSTDPSGYFAPHSNTNVFFKNLVEEDVYGTLEASHTKVDGSMRFLPRDTEGEYYYAHGLISDKVVTSATPWKFGIVLTRSAGSRGSHLAGMRIDFGFNYAVDFDIVIGDSYNTQKIEVRNNTNRIYILTDIFVSMRSADYIRKGIDIIVYTMKFPNTRGRIYSIVIGDGLVFNNEDVKDSTYSTFINETSGDIIQQDFDVDLVNPGFKYDVDNPDFNESAFYIGNSVTVYYGYELDTGSVEWLKIKNDMVISNVQTSREKLHIKSHDRLRDLTGTYFLGKVMNWDIGVELGLIGEAAFGGGKIYTNAPGWNPEIYQNPIPLVSYKEAIQMICNVSGIYVDFSPTLEVIENRPSWFMRINVTMITDEVSGEFVMTLNDMLSDPECIKESGISGINIIARRYTDTYEEGEEYKYAGEVILKNKGDVGYIKYDKKRSQYRLDLILDSAYETGHGIEAVRVKADRDNARALAYVSGGYDIEKRLLCFPEGRTMDMNVLEWDNPLVSTYDQAKSLADKILKYGNETVTYEYDTRGFPEIEAGDVIYQYNPFRENMKVRIIENTLNFNGAFSGHMKVKRIEE